MDRHYDIGLVGCWYWGNYGSILNGYATNQILKSFGVSVLNIVSPYNGFEPHAKKFFKVAYEENEISPVLTFEQLDEYNDVCDMFLTGSDQIWNYNPNKEDKRYDKYFRLDFVRDDKKKISFATSFGNYKQAVGKDQQDFKKLFKRYNAISVREYEGVEILRNDYGIKATQVMEPVLCLDREYWSLIAEHSEYEETEPYMLTYILDPTSEKRKAIEYYGKKLGVKVINILDGFSGIHEKNKRALNLPNTLPNIWCADFLKYFMNARFVITDSFHGVCFSLIFNRPFIAIGNLSRGNGRFESLLSMVNMKERLVIDSNNIPLDEKYLYHVDFDYANKNIEKERKRSIEWLKNSIFNTDVHKKVELCNNINAILPEEKCMGCGACVSACTKDALKLEADQYGVYRSKIDSKKCNNCGLCKKVCAALELPRNLNTSNPISYAFINADKDIVKKSSSGGAFIAVAKTVLRRGGSVVGAAWKEGFTVEHIFIDNENELTKLQKSKYFQSYLGDTFKTVKAKLDKNEYVLFSGTPCQVAGLRKYLGKSYSNLLLVDILCANCPGHGFFKKYLEENFEIDNIDRYDFRYKKEDLKVWNCRTIKVTQKDGQSIVLGEDKDAYMQVFHGCSMALATQCLSCKYQGSTRVGDLTLGDCWGIEHYDKSIDCTKGVSVILVNNEKGDIFLNSIPKEEIGVLKEERLENVKKYNPIAFQEKRNWKKTLKRERFHKEILENSFTKAKEIAEKVDK